MSALASTDDPGRGPSGLATAFLVALGLHLAAVTGLALYRPTPAAPPGENIVTIDLAPQMTEADIQAPSELAQSEVAPPSANPAETPETVSEVKPPEPDAVTPPEGAAVKPPDTAEIQPEEATVAKPLEAQAAPPTEAIMEPPPEDQVVTSTSEQAAPLAPPPPVLAQVPDPPRPVEEARPKPPDPAKIEAEREARREAKRIAEREARRKADQDAKREAVLEAKREAAREAKVKAAREAAKRAAEASAGTARQSSASTSRQSSAGAASAGNDPSALRAWQGALSSAIHGRMNRNAAAGTAGGVAVVRFTVSRSGQVLSSGLSSSSGVGAIDSAALATVRGSLPAAPEGVSVSSLAVTVPLRFSPGR